jgi:hypothetical protein
MCRKEKISRKKLRDAPSTPKHMSRAWQSTTLLLESTAYSRAYIGSPVREAGESTSALCRESNGPVSGVQLMRARLDAQE